MTVAIAAYGLGNIGSLRTSLVRAGRDAVVVEQPGDLRDFGHVVLPGVGSHEAAAHLIHRTGWSEAIWERVNSGAAILGICLGMQLIVESSSETSATVGRSPGLALIPGSVESLMDLGCSLRTPHIGWNSVKHVSESSLMRGVPSETDFYFVHGYAVELPNPAVVSITDYDGPVAAVIEQGGVFGTQFHPEKSSVWGRVVLKNFCEFNGI